MRTTSILSSLLVLAAGSLPAFAQGAFHYEYIELGTLGGNESVAYGLNDLRQVVGWSTIPSCTSADGTACRRAYLWQNGVMTDLGILPGDEESFARAINNNGLIVGTSEANIFFGSGTFHAVEWNGGVINALLDPGSGSSSIAHDVNELGQIAGFSQDPTDNRDSALVWAGGSLVDFGASEPHQYSRAQGISNTGKIAGFGWNLFSPNDSILYDQAWLQIGGSGQFQNSEASDVNDAGVVVGLQAFPSGNWHGAYWAPKAKDAIDTGVLPGTDLSELYDVNEAGLAVGRSYSDADGASRATLFDGTTLYDLNDFLPAGTNVTLFEAREINEAGDIAGTAVVNGAFRGFLLRAMPEWKALGTGLPGSLGEPVIRGFGALEPGLKVEVTLENARPNAPFYLVGGLSSLNAPLLGGVLIPTPDQLFPVLFTDAAGQANLKFKWPINLPSGNDTFWQAWVVDPTGVFGVTSTAGVTAKIE